VCAVWPAAADWNVPIYALWIIIVGAILTCIRRLHHIVGTLKTS
jgi:hypothetical protein